MISKYGLYYFLLYLKTICNANGFVNETLYNLSNNYITFVCFEKRYYETDVKKENVVVKIDKKDYLCDFNIKNDVMIDKHPTAIIHINVKVDSNFKYNEYYNLEILFGRKLKKFFIVTKSEYLPSNKKIDEYIDIFHQKIKKIVFFSGRFLKKYNIINYIIVEEFTNGTFYIIGSTKTHEFNDKTPFCDFTISIINPPLKMNIIFFHKNGKISRGCINNIKTLEKYAAYNLYEKLKKVYILTVTIIFILIILFVLSSIFKCYVFTEQ